jgi:cell division protease FtsH
MVTVYGLSEKLGNISFYDSSGQSEYSFSKPYSEKTAELIDKEVSEMVETAYKRTIRILTDNKDKLEKLAENLLDKEVIFKENLEVIFGKRKWDRDEDLAEKKVGIPADLNESTDTKKSEITDVITPVETSESESEDPKGDSLPQS